MYARRPSVLPGRHVSVTRSPHEVQASLWRRRGVQTGVGVVVIGLASWRYGVTAVGVAITLGAVAFLIWPGTRLRIANAIAALRDGVWVSPPVRLEGTGEEALLTIGAAGVGVTYGVRYAIPGITMAWSEITAIHLTGPPGRPDSVAVASDKSIVLRGAFPAALLDQLIKFGVPVPPA